MSKMNSTDKINQLNKSHFLSIFGNVFEKTDWIAEKVFDLKPFTNIEDLLSKIIKQYESCDKETVLNILNAHPELAVEKKLTVDSKKEQSGASLNNCTVEEFNEFKKLNNEYKKKFNFPFIIAVAGLNKDQVLDNFRIRIKNDINEEFEEAKKQVKKIAIIRMDLILKGF